MLSEFNSIFSQVLGKENDELRITFMKFLDRSGDWSTLDWCDILRAFDSWLERLRKMLLKKSGAKREQVVQMLPVFGAVMSVYLKFFEFYIETLQSDAERDECVQLFNNLVLKVGGARNLNEEFSICVTRRQFENIKSSLLGVGKPEALVLSAERLNAQENLDVGSFDVMLEALLTKQSRPSWFTFQRDYKKENATYAGVEKDYLRCGSVYGEVVASIDGKVFLLDAEESSGMHRRSFQCDHVEPWSLIRDRLSLMEFVLNLSPQYRARLFQQRIKLAVKICASTDSEEVDFFGSALFVKDKEKGRYDFTELAIQILYCNQENLSWLSPMVNLQKSDKCPLKFYLEELPKLYGEAFPKWVKEVYQIDLCQQYERCNTLFSTVESQGKKFYLGSLLREFSDKHHHLLFRLAELSGIVMNNLLSKILDRPQDGSGKVIAAPEVTQGLAMLRALCEISKTLEDVTSSVVELPKGLFDDWLKCLAQHYRFSFLTMLKRVEDPTSLESSQGFVEVTEAGHRIVGWFPSVGHEDSSRKRAKRPRLSLPGPDKNDDLRANLDPLEIPTPPSQFSS